MKLSFIAPHSPVRSNTLDKAIGNSCHAPKKGDSKFRSKLRLTMWDGDIAEESAGHLITYHRAAAKAEKHKKIDKERDEFTLTPVGNKFVYKADGKEVEMSGTL